MFRKIYSADVLLKNFSLSEQTALRKWTSSNCPPVKRRKMPASLKFFLVGLFLGSLSTYVIVKHGAPKTDADGNVIKDEFSDMSTVKQYYKRIGKNLKLKPKKKNEGNGSDGMMEGMASSVGGLFKKKDSEAIEKEKKEVTDSWLNFLHKKDDEKKDDK